MDRASAVAAGLLYLRPPVIDDEIYPGFPDGKKIIGIARDERAAKPYRNGGNQTIREFKRRALLRGFRPNGSRRDIIPLNRRYLLVQRQPRRDLLQLRGRALDLETIKNFVHGHAGEAENAMFMRILSRPAYDDGVVTLKIFRQNVSVENAFVHIYPSEGKWLFFAGAAPFGVGKRNDLVNQRRILGAAEEAEALLKDRLGGGRAARRLIDKPLN